MRELSFQLHVDDGWPPVAVESLPFTLVSGGYRIEVPPLFIKGVSVGDILSASPDEEGRVWEWDVLKKSGHTTIWIGRLKKETQGDIDDLIQKLGKLDCSTTGNRSLGCYAIDVPPERNIDDIDEILESLDADGIGITYPSFRHIDGS